MSLVVLVVLAVQPVLSPTGDEPRELTLTAETGLHDGAHQRMTGEGHAQLVTRGAAVNADRIVYDRNENAATAVGHVVARLFDKSFMVVIADVVTLRFDGDQVHEVFVLDGQAMAKKTATAAQMLAATTAEKAKNVGPTSFLLTGNHLLHQDDGTWHVDTLDLVPCECNFDKPSWRIHSTSADLDLDHDRASMWNASIWVYGVPMPVWFPWLSLPLTERQTGLLFPKPAWTGLNGWSVEQPIFVTLGRSFDLTLTPGYFFGGGPASNGLNPPSYTETVDGIKGPRLQTEFRYVPSRSTSGRLNLDVFYDLKHQRDPVNPYQFIDATRGLRAQGSWFHLQDFGHGLGLRVDGFAQSDGRMQTDLITDVIARQAGYLRSSAALAYRQPNVLVELDAVLRQDLVYGYNLLGATLRSLISSAPVNGPNSIQRWPGLLFSLPLRTLWGPLSFDVHAEAVRHAPLFGGTGDEGTLATDGRIDEGELSECARERMYFVNSALTPHSANCPSLPVKVGQGDGVWQRGEREARDRLMLFPRLFASWQPGGVVSLTAWAGYRQAFWLGELSGRTSQRGYPLLSARAETEWARTFDNGSIRHSVTPLFEVRAVPFMSQAASSGPSAPAPYDEIDLAVPATPGPRVQAVAELRQRLVNRAGREFARLEIGQGYQLLAPEVGAAGLGETYGRLAASFGWWSTAVTARFDPVASRATRLGGQMGLDDGRGDGVGVGYENVLDDGTNRSRQPVDLLFGNRVSALAQSRAQLISGGARARFGPVGLSYTFLLTDHLWNLSVAGAMPVVTENKLTFSYHSLAVGFTPACDCWRMDFVFTQRLLFTPATGEGYLGGPEFSFNFTASRFGSFGVSSN